MKLQNILLKENLLPYTAAAAVLLALVFGSWFFISGYSGYKKEHKAFQRKYRNIVSIKAAQQEEETLRQQFSQLRQKIDGLKLEVKQLEGRFAPLTQEAYEQSKLLVFDLGARCGFRIKNENMPNTSETQQRRVDPRMRLPTKTQAKRKGFLERYPPESLYKRREFKFKASATFAGVQMFFGQLQRFKWHVTPLQFDIVRKDRTGQVEPERGGLNNVPAQARIAGQARGVQDDDGDLELTVVLAL